MTIFLLRDQIATVALLLCNYKHFLVSKNLCSQNSLRLCASAVKNLCPRNSKTF